MDGHAISFGSFRLLAAQRLLLEGGKPVRLGSRAFEILAALVERAGQVVGKEELIARAWPQTVVEESNLKIQVSALRRAIGDGQDGRRYVVTVPGRGYNFVAPVSVEELARAAPSPTITPAGAHNLPLAIARMIGREEPATAIVSRLSRQRLVTIVGPGGIGKTTVALAVAERMIESYEHGVWLVDLAPLGDPRLVPSAVATVLGLEIHTEDPLSGLVAGLRDKRMLLLLDNCEQVIDAAASLAAAVLSGAPGVNILATSREPLGVASEREHRLGPLGSPPSSSGLTAAAAAAFPAVQLFVERVTAIVEDFALTDANAEPVVEICQRLDGLPLAIEFAAPRVEVLGVQGLADRLVDGLPLLGARRRRAVPRHQTMRAVLDWSYGLLSEDEQRFFRTLGIFAGGFTVEAAAAVAADTANTRVDAIDRLADLAAKSLAVADVSGAQPRFRLLDTTRAYAIEKLDKSGDRKRIARRHAEHYRTLFERAEDEVSLPPTGDWLAECAREIDNLRAVLDWALSPDGDAEIGAALTAAAVPLWFQLALLNECRQRCGRALRQLQTGQISDARLKMQLQIGLGNSLLHTRFPSEQAQSVLTEALQSAEALADLHAQLRVLLDLASVMGFRGEYASAAAASERASAIAQQIGDTTGAVLADRRMGMILLRLGRLEEAQRCFERVIHSPLYRQDGVLPSRGHSGERAMARAMLARALWLRGFSQRALQEAQASLGEVGDSDRQLTMCRVLLYGMGRVAPMTGDFAAAETAISSIRESATSAAAPFWTTAGQFLRGKLLVERHQFAEGLADLREAFDTCNQTGWRLSYPEFMGSLALALAGLGRLDEAHDAVCKAIDAAGEGKDDQQWYVPELLRIKGEVLLRQSSDQAVPVAEACLDQAAEMAREQGALFWELRIALSRCRLRMTQGRGDEGRQELAFLYGRFTEGFGTADLVAAKQLLEDLGSADRD